jgi:hypothetical protein
MLLLYFIALFAIAPFVVQLRSKSQQSKQGKFPPGPAG